MRRLACTTLLLCGSAIATTARAGEGTSPGDGAEAVGRETSGHVLTADDAVKFADVLLAEDDPFNALTYYRLALFLDPERADASSIRFREALCYERGERWPAAQRAWQDLAGRDPALSPVATYRAAMTALEAKRYGEARLSLEEVGEEAPGTPWAERAAFMTGVVDLSAGNADAATSDFRQFRASWPQSTLVPRAQATEAVLAERVPRRSPAVAGVMSTVLPGSGQIYAGHTGDGVMAFASNATLATWSYVLFRQGIEHDVGWEVAAGGVIGAMAAFDWTSNVIGAVRGAKRANHHHEDARNQRALGEADDPSLQKKAADVEVGG